MMYLRVDILSGRVCTKHKLNHLLVCILNFSYIRKAKTNLKLCMTNTFNSAFNTAYNVKIKCPSCKEYVYAHAKKCPYCHLDLLNYEKTNNNSWREKATFTLLLIVGLVVLIMILNSINIFLSIILGVITLGLGYFIVLKIQSFRNSLK